MGKKSYKKKERLGKKIKQNRRVPIFVIARTNRAVTQNEKRRAWRGRKLKIKE